MESAKNAAYNSEITSNTAKHSGENEENLAFLTIIYLATFGTKNDHSAMQSYKK